MTEYISKIQDENTGKIAYFKDAEARNQLKNTVKKTVIENGKLYLLKDDGTKIDTGTTLPVVENGSVDLSNYVEKIDGKGLSTNDFTDAYKTKLDNLSNNDGSGSSVSIDDSTTSIDKTWSSDKINSQLNNIANQMKGSNVVDLEKYRIVQADFTYPFTTENYEVAYQNGLGLQKAIDDARNNGVTELTIPAGNYPLCYSGDSQECSNVIINSEKINLKGYRAKLYIIYDELDTGLNPYFTGDVSLAHTMMGKIFATDSDIEGFELVGERGYRTTENAKYREASYGIVLTKDTDGNKIKNCKINRFSGDGIGNGGAMQQLATWLEGADALATSITWNGTSWVSSTTSFTTPRHSIGWADITKLMQIRGKNYRIWSIEPLKIHCFKGILGDDGSYSEGDYIGTVRVRQGEPFYFLEDTYYWYLEIVDSASHTEDATMELGVAIGYGTYRNTIIENCDISLNTRGGISNLPSGSIVRNCDIHHNGCKYGDMVAFYDGTQFGIDIEDWYIHEITIDNCLFYGQLHDILYRCDKINILNTVTFNTIKSLTDTIDFYARNSKFNGNVNLNGGISFGKRIAIGCNLKNGVPANLEVIKSVDIATSDSLGLVKPISKSDDMTQSVGIDENGRLYTLPSSSSAGSTTSGIKWDTLIDKTVSLTDANSILEEFVLQGNYNSFRLYFNRGKNSDNTVTSLRLNQIIINGINVGAFSFDLGNPQTEIKDVYIIVNKFNKIIEWGYMYHGASLFTNQSTMQKGLKIITEDIVFTNKLKLAFNNSYTGDIRIILEGAIC